MLMVRVETKEELGEWKRRGAKRAGMGDLVSYEGKKEKWDEGIPGRRVSLKSPVWRQTVVLLNQDNLPFGT